MTDTTKNTVTYDLASAHQFEETADGALVGLREFIIDSPEMYEIAGEELRNAKSNQKAVEAARISITGPLNAALKATNAVFAKPAAKWLQAEETIKAAMLTYQTEQDRIAREAQAAADKAATAKRLALMAEAAAQFKQAEDLAAAGDAEGHAEALEAAHATSTMSEVMTYTPTAVAAPKVSGISTRTTYNAAVTSFFDLVVAVAAGKAPRECLVADMQFLNAQARAYKKAGALFPGVEVIASQSIAARSA